MLTYTIWNKYMVVFCYRVVSLMKNTNSTFEPREHFFYLPPACGDRDSIPGRDRQKSLEQVVTAPLPNAQQQVWVSRVLGDDHYKGLACVTVDVAC